MRLSISLLINVASFFISVNLKGLAAARNVTVNMQDLKQRISKEKEAMDNSTPDGKRQFYLMHPFSNEMHLEELRGKTLRVVAPKIDPPFVNYLNYSAEEELGYGPGVVMEILREIASELDLVYEFLDFPEDQWGTYDNGTWNGAYDMLVNGEADIIAGATIMQYDRSQASDLTYPFRYELTGILIRSPEQYTDNTFLIVTEPFKIEVWALTAGTIVISAVALKFITHALYNQFEIQFSLPQCVWIFYSVFVQQDFSEMVEAVKSGKYKVVMDGNSQSRMEMIAHSQLKTYQDLWYEMSENNRVSYVDGITEGIELVKSEPGHVLLGAIDTLQINAYINCNVILLSQGLLPTYLTIPLKLHSPYSNYFSKRIRQMVEGGFIKKWIEDYKAWVASQHHNKCDNTTITKVSTNKKGILNLDKAQGAFWIFLSGIGISLISFFGETAFKYIKTIIFMSRKRAARSSNAQTEVTDNTVHSVDGFHEDISEMQVMTMRVGDVFKF